ncbi:UBX domain-containing protein 1 isoform X2 [Phlebotomus papatasi]|uniref:UBX domain-containing protein 1 isoform X2 n=1 Tax=Phlebotomus papatasi TaxID=29031 RepID=UPI002483F9AA|nr:UBX domain-containing protein 1 isoform X2 [Phlebotomus papatasi]
MSDVQVLLDMGFSRERIERALAVTNNKGVEPAMEWLLAHADDELPNEVVTSPPTGTAESVPAELPQSTEQGKVDEAEGKTEGNDETVAKSIKCDECGRQFRSSVEVEYHAVKSGHSSFSESTEEKKPLTEEEKKAQLAALEEKLKQKRLEREEKEKLEALDREKTRIRSGKDLLEARRKMEEIEMAKIIETRKREKIEEKMAKERVRAQIAADKEARRAKMAGETPPNPSAPVVEHATPSSSTSMGNTPPKKYSSTKIQIRLPDGSSVVETFDAKEQLSAVRLFIQLKQGIEVPFRLMTSFPRKVFDEEDFEKPLEVLGLVPSSVVIVTK